MGRDSCGLHLRIACFDAPKAAGLLPTIAGRRMPVKTCPIADMRVPMQSALMQYSSLVAFLSGSLAADVLAEEVAEEVATFHADLRETNHGFIAISDGPNFVMDRAAARLLLHAVAAGHMSAETAVYVADCIVASDDIEFADEATRDAVSFIEDDSSRFIDGGSEMWTQTEILQALAMLD